MSTRPELPPELPVHFSVARAKSLGVNPGRLRTRTLARPFAGVRSRGEIERGSLEAVCHAVTARLHSGQFLSHETALMLWGVPMPEWPYVPGIHVSAYRPAREPRTAGIVGHRLQTREPAFAELRGMPVEDPVRAWRQVGRLWSVGDLVAGADYLISGEHALARGDELRREVVTMGDVRGGILANALSLARVGVRSPRETRLRLLCVRAGLPEPEVAWNLFDARGQFVAELDLAFPRYRVALEYDGRVHAEDARQFARDADRWAAIRALGWEHQRVLNHHMSDDGRLAVGIAVSALRRAGWTPGR